MNSTRFLRKIGPIIGKILPGTKYDRDKPIFDAERRQQDRIEHKIVTQLDWKMSSKAGSVSQSSLLPSSIGSPPPTPHHPHILNHYYRTENVGLYECKLCKCVP